jgi:hypothetical protein
MSRVRCHIIDPKDVDHSLCGRDFRTVQYSVHPLINPRTLKKLLAEGLVCYFCRKEWDAQHG